MELTPMAVYSKAAKAVPSLKYALAVAGVVAAGIIALNLSNQDPRRAILAFIFVLAGMYLVLIFASIGKVGEIIRGPVVFVVWALTILFIAFLVLALSAFAFGVPQTLAKALGAIPADIRQSSSQSDPSSNAASSPRTASAASAVAAPAPAAASQVAVTVTVPTPAAPIPVSETFRISDSSEDCGANQTRTLEYCLPAGATVLNWSGPSIDSANCGSTLSNIRRLPGRDGCIAVDVSVRGCGYDNILGIRNCRGRGWIGGAVVINGQRPGG